MRHLAALSILLLFLLVDHSRASDGNRLVYLDESSPYHVQRTFPKLTTPQWVGEEGVEAVVILAIDDMRAPEPYEKFLRPILNRLKKIDGRAPISIMTCTVDPKHAQLQRWLKEGLSLETHTIDHPCPILARGDLTKAKDTYDRCVDLLGSVPGSRPVAFRTPCCDSLNTPSPRVFAEIFNKKTPKGNFLELDSSIFNVFTPDDPQLPRAVFGEEGRERFRKYLPLDRSFVCWVENYPYPYVLGRLCWEFPCMTPSDWQAQHRHERNNPITVRDWCAALAATVAKQGCYNLVFHPHGWIKAEQVIELIDHAVDRYGKKVKFLTFREARDRLVKHLLGGVPLRNEKGEDNGVRLLDLDGDGYLDVVIGNDKVKQTRLWSSAKKSWIVSEFPVSLAGESGARFGVLHPHGRPSLLLRTHKNAGAWHFDGWRWVEDNSLLDGLELDRKPILLADQGRDRGVRMRDLDGDGICELLVGNPTQNSVFRRDVRKQHWIKLPFNLPTGAPAVDVVGRDAGLRFVDVDEDGRDDVLFSNEKHFGLYLFESMEKGWSRKAQYGKGGPEAGIPPITRRGTDNGAWFHSRHLWVQNEDTALLQHHVDRHSFNALLANSEPGPKSPEASLKVMEPRPGFVAELVAAEPLVQSPIAFAWGPDGKLWVVEMGDYPLGVDGKGKPGGKIKFLESTKGDGKYDKATVFAEGLPFPTSVLPWRKGILVTAAPDILYLEDTNGTGKADLVQKLFTGFVEGNQQHRVNSLVWGLDNWLHGANGDSGGRIKSVKTGKVVDISGRDFRFRPDDGDFEAQTGGTQYGRTRDDWGNWFGNNNSNPLWHFVLADHYQRRNPYLPPPPTRVHVPVVPGAARVYPASRTLPRFNDPGGANHFTSACSPTIYRDDLFGPAFAGNVFISEPVHNLVHREVMSPTGITFRSHRVDDEQTSEFLTSRDNWFRPTTIKTGPDGALWIADMYRHVIEHPQWIPMDWQKRLDLRAGQDKGRIYRIYPEGKTPRPTPRLDKLDTSGLVAALDSPSGWQRDLAHMMLLWKNDSAAQTPLETLAIESKNPLARLHALCTLDGLNAVPPRLLWATLRDPHPGVRRHAARIAERHLAKPRQFADQLLKCAEDKDPFVRLQVAYTIGNWDDPRVGEALGKMAVRDAKDRYLLAAILSSVNAKNLEAVLPAVLKGPGAPPAGLVEYLLRLASALKQPRAIASLLKAVSTPEKGVFAEWQFTGMAGLLDALGERDSSLAALGKDADPAVKEGLQRVDSLFRAARIIAGDSKAIMSERLRAIPLLGRGVSEKSEDIALLVSLLTPQSPDDLQRAAVVSLGKLRDPKVPALLLRGWKGHSPALRVGVLDVLLTREEGAKAVLDALAKKDVLPADIDAVRRQRLLQFKMQAIRERAAKLLAESLDKDRQKVIDSYRAVLTLKGDAMRGQPLFVKHCAACHKLAGIGNDVGPDLAALSDRSAQTLLIAVLDPNRAVEARYQQYLAEMKNGQIFSGVITAETSTSVTLTGADGKPQVILRKDLESLTSTGKSPMPDGLEKDLKPQDLADVFEFLRGTTPPLKRKTFDGNKPELVRPASDGSLGLKPATAEIYGKTLVLEQKYGNLGWWSSEEDHAAWEVEVPRAGKYSVWLDWSCQADSAGNRFLLLTPEGKLTGTVASTGDWDSYRQAKVGEVTLKAGRQRIIFRSVGKIRGALIDLRGLRLIP
jgi:putative membrane-bound dehydrogenase-like protein